MNGGYSNIDVTLITWVHRDIWGENICVNKKYVKEGGEYDSCPAPSLPTGRSRVH